MRNITSYILMLCVWGMMGCDHTEKTSDNKPVAPSHLSYTATSKKLTLRWQDNSSNETEFHIQRKSDIDADWVTIWRTSANETTYEMNVYWLYPNSSFRVTAWNLSGESEPSNTIYVPTYESANLMIYICPNFYDGCSANYIVIDQNCRELQGVVAGDWYNTGFQLMPNHSYAIQFCNGCISNCGSAIAFSTPRVFLTPKFYSSIFAYCTTPCSPPEDSLK